MTLREVAMDRNQLGCNSNYLTPEQLKAMGFGRIETSLGRHLTYEAMVARNLEDIASAQALGMGYTVHLPVFIDSDWLSQYDFYDGFYLDPDADKRERAFLLLEENLSRLSLLGQPDYYVIHFPGIYDHKTVYPNFESLLLASLERLEAIASQYDCQLALEYFPSNALFKDPEHWVETLKPFKRLGILLDTGHLHFGCLLNGFDFDEVLDLLAPHCLGFHIWNVLGTGAYGASEGYQKFHHIVPHAGQKITDGWAFEPASVLKKLAQFNRPIVIEASCQYGGETYFKEALMSLEGLLEALC